MLKKLAALFVIISLSATGSYVFLNTEKTNKETKQEKLYQRMYSATVQVKAVSHVQKTPGFTAFSHGTGWVFRGHNSEVFVWTAGHTLADARRPDKTWAPINVVNWMSSTKGGDGKQLPSPIVYKTELLRVSTGHKDQIEDLALLYIPDNLYASYVYGTYTHSFELVEEHESPRLGEQLGFVGATAGYSSGLFITEGRLGRKEVKMGNFFFEHSTIPAGPGGSGGPVVNSKGKVVGILVGGQTECHTYFISAKRIRDWAKKMQVEYAIDKSIPVPKDKGFMEEVIIEPEAEKKD